MIVGMVAEATKVTAAQFAAAQYLIRQLCAALGDGDQLKLIWHRFNFNDRDETGVVRNVVPHEIMSPITMQSAPDGLLGFECDRAMVFVPPGGFSEDNEIPAFHLSSPVWVVNPDGVTTFRIARYDEFLSRIEAGMTTMRDTGIARDLIADLADAHNMITAPVEPDGPGW